MSTKPIEQRVAEDVSLPAVITTYCAKGLVLAQYEFKTWDQALSYVGYYDLESGNIRTDSVAKITIERGKAE
jgi:hypothetical protein